MKAKYLVIFSFLIFAALTIAAVSAEENVTQDTSDSALAIPGDGADDIQTSKFSSWAEDDHPDESLVEPSIFMDDQNLFIDDPVCFSAHKSLDKDLKAYIDGDEKQHKKIDGSDMMNCYQVGSGNLSIGKHILDVKSSNLTRSFVFDVQPIKVYVPGEAILNEMDSSIIIEFPEGNATGKIVVSNDGKEILNSIVSEEMMWVQLDESNLNFPAPNTTNHVEVRYYDERDNLIYSEDFNVSVGFSIPLDDLETVEKYKNFYDFFMLDSLDMNKMTVTVDGRKSALKLIEYLEWDNHIRYGVDISKLGIGNHNITVSYAGDDKFYRTSSSATICIMGAIEPSSGNWAFDGKNIIFLKLPKDASGNLTVTVDGKEFASRKLVDGYAEISLAGLINYHRVYANYSADDYPVSPLRGAVDIDAFKLTAKDVTGYYGKPVAFKVKVVNHKKNVVKSGKVELYINGKFIKTVRTDKKGYATFKLNKVPGSYKLTAKHGNTKIAKTLKVKHAVTLKTVKVKKSAKRIILKATLKQGKKALKYKKITFKFKGKTYKARTDKKGVAKVTIKKSVLKKLKVGKKVTYQATYLKDTVKKSVKVMK